MKLNDTQKRLLTAIKNLKEQLDPALAQLEDEYHLAEFKAKSPVLDAIRAAQEAGVPMNQISKEAMGMTYVAKLHAWMSPPPSLVAALLEGSLEAKTEVLLTKVSTVTRDSATGDFVVLYQEHEYRVPAFGPNDTPWSTADPLTPEGVYDMIREEYPAWVLLPDEDED